VKIGTKSVLFGAHCFFLHPWFVALAWWKLFGFPWDPRLWVAFFIHDLGYWGKPNMDGPEGEKHPLFGARIMSRLFDGRPKNGGRPINGEPQDLSKWVVMESGDWLARWGKLSLLHSRYYAKRLGMPFSTLCLADKLSIAITPAWLYLPMVKASGEIHEYLKMAKFADTQAGHFRAADYSADIAAWYAELQRYMRNWVAEHKDMRPDTWTNPDRHAKTSTGVWQ
jgi:hypothetical protein